MPSSSSPSLAISWCLFHDSSSWPSPHLTSVPLQLSNPKTDRRLTNCLEDMGKWRVPVSLFLYFSFPSVLFPYLYISSSPLLKPTSPIPQLFNHQMIISQTNPDQKLIDWLKEEGKLWDYSCLFLSLSLSPSLISLADPHLALLNYPFSLPNSKSIRNWPIDYRRWESGEMTDLCLSTHPSFAYQFPCIAEMIPIFIYHCSSILSRSKN